MNPHRPRPSRARKHHPLTQPRRRKRKPFTPREDHPRCTGKGNKLRYKSRAAAENILREITLHGSAKQTPCRVYECGTCGGWHVTSMPRHRSYGV